MSEWYSSGRIFPALSVYLVHSRRRRGGAERKTPWGLLFYMCVGARIQTCWLTHTWKPCLTDTCFYTYSASECEVWSNSHRGLQGFLFFSHYPISKSTNSCHCDISWALSMTSRFQWNAYSDSVKQNHIRSWPQNLRNLWVLIPAKCSECSSRVPSSYTVLYFSEC